ncbi:MULTISPECIES: PAS domain-containing protein [unclassified Leptolyngbya]|uniref:PAS domain-containing protein n=1 Tax=unclassified Leptolyngbya TaxID=2650499 RepID=UPI00168829E9|nr:MULTISPECIES: PAS domain-containing protein [unclassified Leptolyngbya]MBD1913926.1 PAS domain-containing protein [Leptolyngbya sp. FACHB-8]MBD2156378.1 PAS domain-containing protein [Leptolyngbya sp. FACHB-16]
MSHSSSNRLPSPIVLTLNSEANPLPDLGSNSGHQEPEIHRVYRLLRAISESPHWESALDAALMGICQMVGWDCGEVWLRGANSAQFILRTAYCHRSNPCTQPESCLGEFLVARVGRSRHLEWITDQSELEESLLCGATNHHAKIQTACGVPVLASDEIVAVLVFFSEQLQKENLTSVELLQLIASQLGQVAQQKQTEAALRQLNQELEARIERRTMALQESEERWQLAVEASSAGIWDWNLKTNEVFRSRRWKAVRGYEDHEGGTAPDEWKASIHPEDRDRVLAAFADHIAQKTPYFQSEYRILHKDGTCVWILDRGQGLWDDAGNLLRMVGSEVDISPRKRAELALQKSEARYRAIVEDQTALICRFLPDGHLTFANGAYCRSFNLDPNQYDQVNFWDVIADTNLVMVQEQLRGLTPEKPTATYEECDPLPDGTCCWQIWTDRAIFDAQGTVVEYQSVGYDITPRKKIELALQENEVKLRLFVEYAPVAVAMLDEHFRYLVVSNRWRQDYELGDRPLIGHSHYEIFPDLPFPWKQAHQRCLAGAVETREAYPYPRANGQVDWIYWEARPWHRPDGSIGGIVITTEIVTEQRQAQEQMQNLSDRLTLAIRSGAIGIWEWNIAEDVLIWDDRMYELYGVERASFIANGQNWLQMLHPEDYSLVEHALTQTIKGEKEFDEEFRVQQPHGQIRYIKASARLQRGEAGCPERMIGISFDVTERKQAEQQLRRTNEQLDHTNRELERATRLKDEFLANMSHELRTPLNAILGMAEGLQEQVFGTVNERQNQAIATIERSGNHLLELINEILDLSKIEAGKLELDMGPVLVPNLCSTSMTFVRQAAQQKQIRLTTEVADDISMISGDDRRLRQVLINLLTNAVKFTPAGGQVHLQVWREDTSATPYLYFRVIDTGIGIALEDQHKLFQPFVQIDSNLNRQQSGTGLGLALVQRIVELHGGQVWVKSEVGQGSCFTVSLPCRDAHGFSDKVEMEDPGLLPDSALIGGGFSRAGTQAADTLENVGISRQELPVILIVDDNRANIDSIFDYLKHQGYRLILAKNGQDALESMKIQMPDLILMDIQMPGMDGLEVIRQLRTDDNYATVPVIALTALAMPGDRERCLAAGANDYLTKPVRLKHLASTIHTLLHA